MSSLLQHLARFQFIPIVLNIVSAVSFAVVIYLFLHSDITTQNQFAIPSLLVGTWALLLNALLRLLAFSPEKKKTNGFFTRIKIRFFKIVFTTSVIIFTFISLALFYLTFKMLRVWLF